jgi:hypothetical protein
MQVGWLSDARQHPNIKRDYMRHEFDSPDSSPPNIIYTVIPLRIAFLSIGSDPAILVRPGIPMLRMADTIDRRGAHAKARQRRTRRAPT